eukprot:7377845-Prymnesium_polylepis.1
MSGLPVFGSSRAPSFSARSALTACYFLVDSAPYGDGAPWPHSLNGHDYPGLNASETCMELLDDAVNAPLQGGTRSFSHCLYARGSLLEMSTLDFLILYTAFFLLAVEIAADTKEQDFAGCMR